MNFLCLLTVSVRLLDCPVPSEELVSLSTFLLIISDLIGLTGYRLKGSMFNLDAIYLPGMYGILNMLMIEAYSCL